MTARIPSHTLAIAGHRTTYLAPFRTIDKLAQGVDALSAFSLLRNATSGRAVHELPSSSKQYNDKPDHEANLSHTLKTLGAR